MCRIQISTDPDSFFRFLNFWKNSLQKFEDELNNHAEQGWRVINVYNNSNGIINAVLEKDKK